MPRPRLRRRVGFMPGFHSFRPVGVKDPNEIVLTIDEFEAVRLKDFENLEQEKAAKKMKISQPTFNRIIKTARKKIADAIVNGKLIRIQGGEYQMVQPRGRGQGRGPGGRMGGFGAGPGGMCKCPSCGYEEPQQRAIPCMNKKCPKCNTMMTRG